MVVTLQKPKKYPKLQENQNRLYLLQQYRTCQNPFYSSLQKEQKISNLPLQSGNQTDPRLDLILTVFIHLVCLVCDFFYWGSWLLLGQVTNGLTRKQESPSFSQWPLFYWVLTVPWRSWPQICCLIIQILSFLCSTANKEMYTPLRGGHLPTTSHQQTWTATGDPRSIQHLSLAIISTCPSPSLSPFLQATLHCKKTCTFLLKKCSPGCKWALPDPRIL